MSDYEAERDTNLVAIGLRIKGFRLSLGMSQEELSDRADLHRTYISSVESGARNISVINLIKIAEALNVPVTSLLSD